MKKMAVLVLACAFAAHSLFSTAKAADSYPTKPIELTIGFAAGVSADIIARKLAGIAEKELGQPIVVTNRPGAGSALSVQYMARQKPDGYNILWISNAISTAYLLGNMPVTYRDFDMIAGITSEQSVISVRADAKWKNFKEFVEDAKSRPEEISVANGGVGSFNHLTAVALENVLGVKFHHIPFSTSIVPPVLGGQVDSGCAMAFSNIPLAQSGELRLLVSTGLKPIETVKGVPTMIEEGYDFSMFMYRGVVAPKGTPKDIIAKVEAAFKVAAESEEFKEYARQSSIDVNWMGADEFTTFIAKDFDFLSGLMEGMGIRKQK